MEDKAKLKIKSNGSEEKNTLALAGLIFSILSLPGLCCGVCCLPLPLIGLGLSGFAYYDTKNRTGKTDNMAIIGIVISLSVIALTICGMFMGLGFSFLDALSNTNFS